MKKLITVGICLAFGTAGHPQTLTLEDALLTAKKSRPAIRAATSRHSEARAFASAAAAYPATTLRVGASSPTAIGGDDDLVLTQPLDIFGRTGNKRDASRSTSSAADFQRFNALLDVQTEVLVAYAEAAAADRKANTASQILEIANQLLQAVRRKVEEGTVPAVQLERSQIEVERFRSLQELAAADRAAALVSLGAAIGSDHPVDAVAREFAVPRVDSSSVPEHPRLAALRASAAAARAEARVAAKAALPDLEIQGRQSAWGDDRRIYGLRVQLSWPLVDHRRAALEQRATESRADAIEQEAEDLENLLSAELRAVTLHLDAARRHVVSLQAISATARNLVEKARRAYSEGVGTFIDLLEATRVLREAEADLAAAELTLNTTLARQLAAAGYLMEVLK